MGTALSNSNNKTSGRAPSSGSRRPSRSALAAASAEELLAHISGQMNAQRGRQVVHIEKLAARQAHYATPSPPLPALLQRALDFMGISQLYTHQVESIERVRDGENIVVVTATSSGKTLCYNLPIIEALLQDRSARALYIYPINALVNDQLKSLFKTNLMLGKEAIGIAKYTGALNSEQRRAVRARDPRILLTNPEMLHLSFLLWHKNWEALWHNLRFIVVDEVHTYRGVLAPTWPISSGACYAWPRTMVPLPGSSAVQLPSPIPKNWSRR